VITVTIENTRTLDDLVCRPDAEEYTPTIAVWSIGCIFVDVLTGKPLFPGKSGVHQLHLITDLFGTHASDAIFLVFAMRKRGDT